jgi:dihydrofolate reductase
MVQYYAAQSLDGFIARPDGSIDWLQNYGAGADLGAGPMSDGSYDRFYEGIGAVVMGSKTYEYVHEHVSSWPYEVPSFVFSSRNLTTLSGDIEVVSGDVGPVNERAVASAAGKNVWLVGGGALASQYVAAGLLDEVIVTVVPVVLGEGLPLFAQGVSDELRLADLQRHENGMVALRYTFAG